MKSVEEQLDDAMKRWDEDAERYRIRAGLSEEKLQEMREDWKKRLKSTIIVQRKIKGIWAEEHMESANSLINRGYGSSTPTTIELGLKPADWLEHGLKKKLARGSEQ